MDIYLRAKIRELLHQYADTDVLPTLETKIRDLLISFRFVIETTGGKLSIQEALTTEQKILFEIINDLKQDESVQRYLNERRSLSKEEISQRLKRSQVERLYIYEFNYLDASRMMLFHFLQQSGIEVIFRVPFNSKLEKLYEGWKVIYEAVSNRSSDQWSNQQDLTIEQGNAFAHFINGTPPLQADPLKEKLTVLDFNHPVHINSYLEKHPIRNGIHEVFAVSNEDLNRHLGLEISDHLFATPKGKFLLLLEQCSKLDQEILVSYETFIDLIVSGWIISQGVSGERALGLLTDLRSYMDGVKTIGDIKERLATLDELQETSKIFDQAAKEQTQQHRAKHYLTNPFRVFPYVHQNRYQITIKQLIECTKDLERKLTKLLLAKGEVRQVQQYISDLQQLFDSVKPNWNDEAADRFARALHIHVPSDWVFSQEELQQVITLHLTQDLEEPEQVQSFTSIVGAVLEDKHIHMTDLSLQSFPGYKPSLPYLLTHGWLKRSVQKSFVGLHKQIRIHALLVDYYSREYAPSLSVYLLYHVLAHCEGTLTLSWIKDLQANNGPSMYFTLIQKIYGAKPQNELETTDAANFDWPEAAQESQPDVNTIKGIPDVYWLDYDFCARKFFYSAILEQQPIYENDLHQKLSFGIIGSLLSEQAEGRKEFKETIYPLFPQWTTALKDNLIDTEYTNGLRTYKSFENIYFPKSASRLQRLRSQYVVTKRYKIRNQFREDRFKEDDALKEFVKHIEPFNVAAEKGDHCKMCPHLSVCEEGEYSIDASTIE